MAKDVSIFEKAFCHFFFQLNFCKFFSRDKALKMSEVKTIEKKLEDKDLILVSWIGLIEMIFLCTMQDLNYQHNKY